MIIKMQTDIARGDLRVLAVEQKAEKFGLRVKTETSQGAEHIITMIHLHDGQRVKPGSIGDYVFENMDGVEEIIRVTPSLVSVASNGLNDHVFRLGSLHMGKGNPCGIIPGPCTVDQTIFDHLLQLSEMGYKVARGGVWKPRSSHLSYRGPGEKGLYQFMEAAAEFHFEAICTEVMDTSHLQTVRRVKEKSGYKGIVALWVGARTSNQVLLDELGLQDEFPIMIKNGLHDESIDEIMARSERVLAGELHWDDDGKIIPEKSLRPGNDQVAIIWRGRMRRGKSRYRFDPAHYGIGDLVKYCCLAVLVDPSHSAGHRELIMMNTQAALLENPHGILLETWFDDSDDRKPLCDAEQAVPLSMLPKIQELVDLHNKKIQVR